MINQSASFSGIFSPDEENRYPENNYQQPRESIIRLIFKQNYHDRSCCKNVNDRDYRVPESFIWARDIRSFFTQDEYCKNCKGKKDKNGKDHIIEQVTVGS